MGKEKSIFGKGLQFAMILVMIAVISISMLQGIARVSAISQTPQIQVTLINQEPDPVSPGNTVDVRFRIENLGSDPATNMQVRLVPKYPFSFYGGQNDTLNIGSVEASQNNALGVREKWTLLVDPKAATGSNSVEFWYNIDDTAWVKAGDYDLAVRTPENVLAINEIKSDPANIIPGTKTKVSFVLQNLADNTLKDIKLKLDVLTPLTTAASITFRELPFTPIDSGDEKTLSSLSRGESQQIDFILYTDADALSKVYKVPYELTYSDASGVNFTTMGIVGLLVDSDPELSIYLDSTDIFTAGTKGKASIKIVNKGFSDIKFMDVKLGASDNYDILSASEVYIGKLDSDDYETADYSLFVKGNAPNPTVLPMHVEYRDANGHLFTKDVPINLGLYSGTDLQQRTGAKNNTFLWLLGLVVLVVIGFFIYKRIRGKKKKS